MTISLKKTLQGVGIIVLITAAAGSALGQTPGYDQPLRHLNDFPADSEPAFANNIQGLAHSVSHWYITQTMDLWRFPLSMSWGDVDFGESGVQDAMLEDYWDGEPFVDPGFDHMGDLEFYNNCGEGLLLIPLHGDNPHRSAILVVRSIDLVGIGWQSFGDSSRDLCGWLAIDPGGDAYIGGIGPGRIERRRLDCGALASNFVQFDLIEEIDLFQEDGTGFDRGNKQGGCFSANGALFILGTGYEDGGDEILDGLHVFDTSTWQRVAHSVNGPGLFNYPFDFDEWPEGEEPEGMTWMDLDGGPASGMHGQLHVLLLNNDITPDPDNIWLKHYTYRIYVNGDYTGNGTYGNPYGTVTEAANLAWGGCEIRIAGGTYPEAVTFDRRCKLIAQGGTVRIGG